MESRPTITELFREVEYPIELFNKQGDRIYYENDRGDWAKWEYDAQGNQTYYEDSDGYWVNREYDAQGNETYYRDSIDYWVKKEYDAQGNRTYFEDSNGEKRGTPKNAHQELTVEQIEERLGYKIKIINKG